MISLYYEFPFLSRAKFNTIFSNGAQSSSPTQEVNKQQQVQAQAAKGKVSNLQASMPPQHMEGWLWKQGAKGLVKGYKEMRGRVRERAACSFYIHNIILYVISFLMLHAVGKTDGLRCQMSLSCTTIHQIPHWKALVCTILQYITLFCSQ